MREVIDKHLHQDQAEAITNIFVRPCKNLGNLKGIASVNYHGLCIRNLKLVDGGPSGFHLSMPARKRGDEWEDICFFLDANAKEEVTRRILAEYEKVLRDIRVEEGAATT